MPPILQFNIKERTRIIKKSKYFHLTKVISRTQKGGYSKDEISADPADHRVKCFRSPKPEHLLSDYQT